jgi:hypothetical protein
MTFFLRCHTISLFKYYVSQCGTLDWSFLQLHIFVNVYSSYNYSGCMILLAYGTN